MASLYLAAISVHLGALFRCADAAWPIQILRTKTDQDGPWEALGQTKDIKGRNICQGGKQLPDFYVIGQQKCGTSSIAQDLMEVGVKNVHGPQNDKEFHFFDAVTRLNYSLVGKEGLEANRAAWRDWMPGCPPRGNRGLATRNVLADFTPAYQGMVKRPDSFVPQGPWLKAFDVSANVPAKMREMYGEFASNKLQFAIMIREPLSQMQSAWYHAESFQFRNVCASCKAPSFRHALKSAIHGLQQSPPEFTQWVWNIMYARHIEEWFVHFKPSQFYVIPTNVYSKGDNAAICRDLSRRLDFQMQCQSRSGESETTHAWSHEHPSLDKDVKGLREVFEKLLLKTETDRLLSLLAHGSKNGMGLANYKGKPGDRGAIQSWLEAGW